MAQPLHFPIARASDVEAARRAARELAGTAGLDTVAAEAVALAVSELATNLLRYAQDGVIALAQVQGARGAGVQVESRDTGPGIADLGRALEDGYSTGGGLGSGLPAVRRLMDEFDIATDSTGTRIVACKWPPRRSP